MVTIIIDVACSSGRARHFRGIVGFCTFISGHLSGMQLVHLIATNWRMRIADVFFCTFVIESSLICFNVNVDKVVAINIFKYLLKTYLLLLQKPLAVLLKIYRS